AVDVSVAAPKVDGVESIEMPIELFNAANAHLWGAKLKLEPAPDARWKGSLALEKIGEPKQQHRLELNLRHAALGIDYKEKIFFGPQDAKIQTYGLKSLGTFPRRKEILTIGLGGLAGREVQELPLTIKIQDAEGNVIADRQSPLRPKAEPLLEQVDVTP